MPHPNTGSRRKACKACVIQKTGCRPLGPGLPCRQCHGLGIDCSLVTQPISEAESSEVSILPPPATFSPPSSSGGIGQASESVSSRSPTREELWNLCNLCAASTLSQLLQDYVLALYPLTPIVRRNALQSYFCSPCNYTAQEPDLFSVVLSLCCYSMATFPRKLTIYQARDPTLANSSPLQFLQKCEEYILSKRPTEYFESSTQEKCAIAYFLGLSYNLVGLPGRCFWYLSEMRSHIRRSGYDCPANYTVLDPVQAELAKRTFWLYFITEIHDRLFTGYQEERWLWDPIPEGVFFRTPDLPFLLGLEDNQETDHDATVNLKHLVAVFLTFQPKHEPNHALPTDTQSSIYDTMLSNITEVLDNAPLALVISPPGAYQDPTSFTKMGAILANVQVTRLWATSLILERLILHHEEHKSLASPDLTKWWAARVKLGEDLLSLLESVTLAELEANGPPIIYKIRRIAGSLVHRDTGIPEQIITRAAEILHRILVLLAELNRFSG